LLNQTLICQYSLIFWLVIHINTLKIRFNQFSVFTALTIFETVTSPAEELLNSFIA